MARVGANRRDWCGDRRVERWFVRVVPYVHIPSGAVPRSGERGVRAGGDVCGDHDSIYCIVCCRGSVGSYSRVSSATDYSRGDFGAVGHSVDCGSTAVVLGACRHDSGRRFGVQFVRVDCAHSFVYSVGSGGDCDRGDYPLHHRIVALSAIMKAMELILVVLLIAIIVGLACGLIILAQKINKLTQQSAVELVKSDVVELSRSIAALQQTMGDKLERSQLATQQSVQKQLSESAKLVADVTQRLTKLDETNKRVVDVATDLKTLQNVLQNPKQRGVFGEYYLSSVLENVLAPGQYQTQYKFKDGEIVDAVILLDKGRILPIDSKFSLENYNRMINASGKEREQLLVKVKADLKGRIDETSKYIRPGERTMDFAFMFIPSESLYYDLLINNVGNGGSSRDLIEYAFRDKHVIIVSPTSFMAYLQTVLQGLRSLQIEEQAKDIQVRVGKLGQHIAKYDEYMNKLGNSLGTTVNHYNNAYKEFGKVDKDVVKITGRDTAVEPLLIDRPSARD